ncbi:MAG: multicopper oxidase domain-containing protein [Mycobacteriales bacterium]
MRLLHLLVVPALVAGCTSGTTHHTSDQADGGGTTRTYYVSADEVLWDYAPSGRNQVTGVGFTADQDVFVKRAKDRIGSRYLKCLYRGYTDATFGTAEKRPAADAYLGDLGPTLHAEVGDTVKVVFRNTCRFPTSMHPHGVRYDKHSEGAAYNDGSGEAHPGSAVPTGKTVTYTWEAAGRSGPGPMDGDSAVWMYHSHADEIGDVYAGLSGFLVVTAKGKARADGSPKAVDREVFSLYEVDDENQSPLLPANLRGVTADTEDEDFAESNLMHSINGYVYGNGPVVQLKKGQRVRWYVMAMGTEVDLHTPHWHGNTVVANGMRTDVVSLLPAGMLSADMTPDATGTWLFHCHVGDHIAAGMQARYHVVS